MDINNGIHHTRYLDSEVHNIKLSTLIGTIALLVGLTFAIVTNQYVFLSALLGITGGGILGPVVIIYLNNKFKKNLTKTRKELNYIFDNYSNKTLMYVAILSYILIFDSLIILKSEMTSSFNLSHFIFYILFSFLISSGIYSYIESHTSWSKYNNNK